jgi:SAM-dependent methyltransferase
MIGKEINRKALLEIEKFEQRFPAHQNAIDLFKGRWASDLGDILPGAVSGDARHFGPDEPRVEHAIKHFGKDGKLSQQRILELGPLEGGHTFGLERAGADVLGIEGNAEAYLKCLIVKEITKMKSEFLLGDFSSYLRETKERYDVVFASGVLYHMSKPLDLIEQIAKVTDKCLLWTHVYNPEKDTGPKRSRLSDDNRYGKPIKRWSLVYGSQQGSGRYWGGLDDTAVWLEREGLFDAFRANGFNQFDELPQTNPYHETIQFAAWRA